MAKTLPRHRVLREVIRNYTVWESLCSQTGEYTISHGEVTLSFLDLQGCLKKLSPRKKEAVFFHVILDWRQRDVAEHMGISMVTVGQYAEQACLQIAKQIWPDFYADKPEEED